MGMRRQAATGRIKEQVHQPSGTQLARIKNALSPIHKRLDSSCTEAVAAEDANKIFIGSHLVTFDVESVKVHPKLDVGFSLLLHQPILRSCFEWGIFLG